MILGFQQRFVPAVADGTKPHTIRAGSRWKEGDKIHFYQNVRQKSMAKIRPDDVARVVQKVEMKSAPEQFLGATRRPVWQVFVEGRALTPLEAQVLACTDGFDSFAEMAKWFKKNHGFPFTGQLICWTDLRY